jgi:hypothetical protein
MGIRWDPRVDGQVPANEVSGSGEKADRSGTVVRSVLAVPSEALRAAGADRWPGEGPGPEAGVVPGAETSGRHCSHC